MRTGVIKIYHNKADRQTGLGVSGMVIGSKRKILEVTSSG